MLEWDITLDAGLLRPDEVERPQSSLYIASWVAKYASSSVSSEPDELSETAEGDSGRTGDVQKAALAETVGERGGSMAGDLPLLPVNALFAADAPPNRYSDGACG
jgi:hypothetical protein